jgi:glycosyltransferase involved in cell wall biosynthesis
MSMANNKNLNIAIFDNLPTGGGKRLLDNLTEIIRSNYQIKRFQIKNYYNFYTFFHYLYFVFFQYKNIHKKIAQIIDKENFDLVFVNHDYLTKSPYLLRYLVTKSFYLCHEEPREFYSDRKYLVTNIENVIVNLARYPIKIIDQHNVCHATYVLANSKYSKHKLENIYRRSFINLKLGIDTTIFTPINKTKIYKYYLTIGAISKFKGIDFLIRSIAKLPKEFQYPLVVVGDKGRDYKYIIKLANRLGIEIVEYQHIKDNRLIDLYRNATLYLAAARNEPFGLSLLEAISCGIRVVAINEGGYREIIIDNKVGVLTKPSEANFSQAIYHSLKYVPDKMYMHKFINDNWNINNTYKQLLQIFNENL